MLNENKMLVAFAVLATVWSTKCGIAPQLFADFACQNAQWTRIFIGSADPNDELSLEHS